MFDVQSEVYVFDHYFSFDPLNSMKKITTRCHTTDKWRFYCLAKRVYSICHDYPKLALQSKKDVIFCQSHVHQYCRKCIVSLLDMKHPFWSCDKDLTLPIQLKFEKGSILYIQDKMTTKDLISFVKSNRKRIGTFGFVIVQSIETAGIDWFKENKIHFIREPYLLKPVIDHSIVPKCRVVPSDEVKELCSRRRFKLSNCPKIRCSDPLVVNKRFKVGDLIETVHNYPTRIGLEYRLVVDHVTSSRLPVRLIPSKDSSSR